MTNLKEQIPTPQPSDNTRLIPLTQGQFAIVDSSDFEWLNQWKWCASYSHNGKSFYACRATPKPNRKMLWMHRVILDLNKGEIGDHKNGNTLDNRRDNLRKCTHAQNMRNSKPREGKFKGVRKKGLKWESHITVDNCYIYLGMHDSEYSAARSYDAAAVKYSGEFARLNFPLDTAK